MLSSWKKKPEHNINNFYVIDPNNAAGDFSFSRLDDLAGDIKPDVILFAVKPQNLSEVLPEYKKRFGAKPLYISIAAGKNIGFFEDYLGGDAAIIRAMPNTPAFVGKAMTALCANNNVKEAQKNLAAALFTSFGKVVWVAENDMDAVTAVSGSGPAYLFLFLEAFTKAAINSGLNEETAKILVSETVHGAVHLAEKSGKPLPELRANVTSKGGTTEAALSILMENNSLEELLDKAVKAAVNRSKTLA